MDREEHYRIEDRIRIAQDFMKVAESFFLQSRHAMSASFPLYNLIVHGSYYAVFHASKALLALHGLFPETHKGVRAMLHNYIREQNPELVKIFDRLMDMKQHSDYDVYAELSYEDALRVLELAERFLITAREVIRDFVGKTQSADNDMNSPGL